MNQLFINVKDDGHHLLAWVGEDYLKEFWVLVAYDIPIMNLMGFRLPYKLIRMTQYEDSVGCSQKNV